ncbi:MAG TPA: hypothetical protein VJI66_01770 [Candidatus Paceibacterota bacterium]
MPNGLSNWTYRDVTDFLTKNDFEFYKYVGGSHEYWIRRKDEVIVDINKITHSESYRFRTLETMIRQSKIDKKTWRKWAGQ